MAWIIGSFQLILFNPIGRVHKKQLEEEWEAGFQLILFNPIGRALKEDMATISSMVSN